MYLMLNVFCDESYSGIKEMHLCFSSICIKRIDNHLFGKKKKKIVHHREGKNLVAEQQQQLSSKLPTHQLNYSNTEMSSTSL